MFATACGFPSSTSHLDLTFNLSKQVWCFKTKFCAGQSSVGYFLRITFIDKPFRSTINLGKEVWCINTKCATCPSRVCHILRISFLDKPFGSMFNLGKQVWCFKTELGKGPSNIGILPVALLPPQSVLLLQALKSTRVFSWCSDSSISSCQSRGQYWQLTLH